jgi:hypothetical protein
MEAVEAAMIAKYSGSYQQIYLIFASVLVRKKYMFFFVGILFLETTNTRCLMTLLVETSANLSIITHQTHLNQYLAYLEDGGRRKHVHTTDTGNQSLYSQCQPGIQLEEGNWSENYNYIRPSQSSIRDEA